MIFGGDDDTEYAETEKRIWNDVLGARAPGRQIAGQTVVQAMDIRNPNKTIHVFTLVIVDDMAIPLDEVMHSLN